MLASDFAVHMPVHGFVVIVYEYDVAGLVQVHILVVPAPRYDFAVLGHVPDFVESVHVHGLAMFEHVYGFVVPVHGFAVFVHVVGLVHRCHFAVSVQGALHMLFPAVCLIACLMMIFLFFPLECYGSPSSDT